MKNRSQKISITLRGYTALVEEFNRLKQEIKEANQRGAEPSSIYGLQVRRATLEYVVEVLELPIN